jgi:hypothetical protein
VFDPYQGSYFGKTNSSLTNCGGATCLFEEIVKWVSSFFWQARKKYRKGDAWLLGNTSAGYGIREGLELKT